MNRRYDYCSIHEKSPIEDLRLTVWQKPSLFGGRRRSTGGYIAARHPHARGKGLRNGPPRCQTRELSLHWSEPLRASVRHAEFKCAGGTTRVGLPTERICTSSSVAHKYVAGINVSALFHRVLRHLNSRTPSVSLQQRLGHRPRRIGCCSVWCSGRTSRIRRGYSASPSAGLFGSSFFA
jgi:hypothetical protein